MLRAHEAGDPLNIKPDGVDRETFKRPGRNPAARPKKDES
jgi:hypothetical protein